jgi:tetratricopeptide (TPR) repeat protein
MKEVKHSRSTLEKIEEKLGADSREALRARANLILRLCESGKVSEAVKIGELAVQKGIQNFGEEFTLAASAMINLGNALWELGERSRAATMFKRALNVRKRPLGEDNDDTTYAKNRLKMALKNLSKKELAAFNSVKLEVSTSCGKHKMHEKSGSGRSCLV